MTPIVHLRRMIRHIPDGEYVRLDIGDGNTYATLTADPVQATLFKPSSTTPLGELGDSLWLGGRPYPPARELEWVDIEITYRICS